MKAIQRITTDTEGETFVHQAADRRSPYLLWLVWVAWLPFITPTLVGFFQSHPSQPRIMATLVGGALFFGIYMWASWHYAHRLVAQLTPAEQVPAAVWLPIAMLVALGSALVLGNGHEWFAMFYFTAGYAGGRLPLVRAVQVISGLMLVVVGLGLVTHAGLFSTGQAVLYVTVIGGVIIGMMQAITTSRELRVAREEIARLAVMAERLRIARDLHDLLGHNLALITLKSELAGRLLSVSPERAVVEIGDVERVARTTLQEVREAVASYRQPTLVNELHGAEEILAAAGIEYRYEGDEPSATPLPAPIEVVLGWAVREGVTNIVRHSRAQNCVIRLMHARDAVKVEIIDDGMASTNASNTGGNGLRGLAERVVTLDGQLDAAPLPGGGFRLAVSVPLVLRVGTTSAPPPVLAQHVPLTSLPATGEVRSQL